MQEKMRYILVTSKSITFIDKKTLVLDLDETLIFTTSNILLNFDVSVLHTEEGFAPTLVN